MFDKIIQQITELSQLPVFTGGRTEHALFVILLVAIALCVTVLIVLVVRAIIKGIVELWRLVCEIKQRSLETKVKIEQEVTERTRITGKRQQ
ncbi:MAG: hypothetical protein WCP92_06110 [bacterium]